MIKLSHIISEMRKITLQIRLLMIFMFHLMLWKTLHMILTPYQAISGENFSQSEYVAFGAISQFAFPPLAKAIHHVFDYVNLSNLCSKQAFHS